MLIQINFGLGFEMFHIMKTLGHSSALLPSNTHSDKTTAHFPQLAVHPPETPWST